MGGGPGDDHLVGDSKGNGFTGGGGDDSIFGSDGEDFFYTGLGRTEFSQEGATTISALMKDRTMWRPGPVTISSKRGTVTIVLKEAPVATGSLAISAPTGPAFRRMTTRTRIWGQAGADELSGDGGNDHVIGGGGSDVVRGLRKAQTAWREVPETTEYRATRATTSSSTATPATIHAFPAPAKTPKKTANAERKAFSSNRHLFGVRLKKTRFA